MASRVTIQDIADELGLSRNTVSKAINNTGILADTTRNKILAKAVEMGYKQFSYSNIAAAGRKDIFSPDPSDGGEIALFTIGFLGSSHFSSTMMDKFQREITLLGYSLTMHRVLPEEIASLSLPASFNRERTSGIICFEIFNPEYSHMLCETGIPLLFVDSPVSSLAATPGPLKADCLYMDNETNIFLFVKEMLCRGKNKIGFVGEYLHCQSFFERYMAYRNALYLLGQPFHDEYCILKNRDIVKAPTSEDYQAYLEECITNITKMPSLPDVFICANDFVAIDLIHALKKLGITVPEDVYLCGFDDSPESRIITPSLTTVHIHSEIMAISAVQLLISRIREPSLNFRTVHTETSLIYRESTED